MIDRDHPLLLGSSSPRRREILTTLGFPLRCVGADVDETRRAGEGARTYLERVTLAKLLAVRQRPEVEGAGAILVADTAVILDGAVLGKPRDEADARAMIQALAGREHEVWTRFAVTGPAALPGAARAPAAQDPGGTGADEAPVHAETVATRVRFRALDDEEITGYAATGEGLDKAGAYAVQGIGAFMVARIEGSYSNVVGLPAGEVVAALRRTGLLARFPLVPPLTSPTSGAPAP